MRRSFFIAPVPWSVWGACPVMLGASTLTTGRRRAGALRLAAVPAAVRLGALRMVGAARWHALVQQAAMRKA